MNEMERSYEEISPPLPPRRWAVERSTGVPARNIEELKTRLESYLDDFDADLLQAAYEYAQEKGAAFHWDSIAGGKEEPLAEVLEVTSILVASRLDFSCILAGLLHASACTAADIAEIEERFGEEVAQIVRGVCELRRISLRVRENTQAELYREMVVAMARDLRVIFIELAIRIVRLRRSLRGGEPQGTGRFTLARESLEVYAPLANRFGFQAVKVELEDLALQILHPETFREIEARLTEIVLARESYIEETRECIRETLEAAGISCRVTGRVKHYYSIYRKMVKKNIDLSQVYDLIAFRVIVPTLPDCYGALGIIHARWRPVPGRLKDYIAVPKPNGYQSLHTSVIGPHNEIMEIQIRTEEMHQIAEFGVAAHWKYKEGIEAAVPEDQWTKTVLELQKGTADPKAYVDLFRLDLFEEEVYVFTPNGDLRRLPRGATPLDFAYSIHTEIGDRAVQARVNGRIVPLRYELKNGDRVEIITSPHQNPKKDWLKFVKTSRARSKIRLYFKKLERDRLEKEGREALERELKRRKISLSRLIRQGTLQQFAEAQNLRSVEQLYLQIGNGELNPETLVERLFPHESPEAEIVESPSVVSRKRSRQASSIVEVSGLENVLVHFAGCCKPLPGDPITGFITRGRGVSIHHEACQRILDLDPARRIDVRWIPADTTITQRLRIEIRAADKPGMLAEVSKQISQHEANIASGHIKPAEPGETILVFELEVKNRRQLDQILERLRSLKGIYTVRQK
ncbi:MAG: bifunctional (p)ppGpp synthetase/guanosine-3',5'-bis(diphosphate) 3'-pyrophosphohydrolase [Deltaproteobacteria bacterium]|nr:MAG: bifunctional (p)ppGpp synthetase/guanosine-3',5'-bis(diphosphate) 3'-pyrophosphohydrolase [Deltaproteobacteria bacterium]